MLGLGDLCVEAIARDEAEGKRWLRQATEAELLAGGICPRCRGRGCDACRMTGDVIVCEDCGTWMAPGLEQVIPIHVDQPNGPKATLCLQCATAADDLP